MICIMHEAEPYGHLVIAGKPVTPALLARQVREKETTVNRLLKELKNANVFDVFDNTIISRRMIRDEKVRQSRAKGGRLGGNPALLKVNQ